MFLAVFVGKCKMFLAIFVGKCKMFTISIKKNGGKILRFYLCTHCPLFNFLRKKNNPKADEAVAGARIADAPRRHPAPPRTDAPTTTTYNA